MSLINLHIRLYLWENCIQLSYRLMLRFLCTGGSAPTLQQCRRLELRLVVSLSDPTGWNWTALHFLHGQFDGSIAEVAVQKPEQSFV